ACNYDALRLLATPQSDWNGREFLDVIGGSPLESDLRALLAPPVVATTCHLTYERADGLHVVELRLRPFSTGDARGTLLLMQDRTDYALQEQVCEQRVHHLSMLNRIARAANSTLETDELLHAIVGELVRVLPSARVLIGLLQPDGTTLRLVADEQLHTASTMEDHAITGYDATWLQHILPAGQPRVISVADPQLAWTPVRSIFQREGVRTVLVVPLASPVAMLGAIFVG